MKYYYIQRLVSVTDWTICPSLSSNILPLPTQTLQRTKSIAEKADGEWTGFLFLHVTAHRYTQNNKLELTVVPGRSSPVAETCRGPHRCGRSELGLSSESNKRCIERGRNEGLTVRLERIKSKFSPRKMSQKTGEMVDYKPSGWPCLLNQLSRFQEEWALQRGIDKYKERGGRRKKMRCDVKEVKRNDRPTKWEGYAAVLSVCSKQKDD